MQSDKLVKMNLRKTSDNPEFPWKSKRAPFIKIDFDNKTIEEAQSKNDKISLIDDDRAFDKNGVVILAAWPGEWSQDIFEVDDIEQAFSELMKKGRV